MKKENIITCDVIVLGGGVAACFAAIKAREAGADVVMVDKGCVGNSGQSPYAATVLVYNSGWGMDIQTVHEKMNISSEYINNRFWAELVAEKSYERFLDFQSYGVEFKYDKNGEYLRIPEFGPMSERVTLMIDESRTGRYGAVLRKKLDSLGVRIYDRMMACELIKCGGRVSGVIALPAASAELYVFSGKAVISCVGACGFKPTGYPPLVQLTGDGEGMAYRAGAAITGKEFVDVHHMIQDLANMLSHERARQGLGNICEDLNVVLKDKTASIPQGIPQIRNCNQEIATSRPRGASMYPFAYESLYIQVDQGLAPFDAEGKSVMGGAALGMSIRKADGLWPADHECRSTIPGLFAAGDALGTMENGAVYSLPGGAVMGGAVTGTIAGEAAAKEILNLPLPKPDEDYLSDLERGILAPLHAKGGFGPRWLMQILYNTMMPYYISYVTSGDRLRAALTMVEFMQKRIVPKLRAEDSHELRLAIEAKNMVLTAEMRLRSGLFRTESRGNHYREDYPFRDDENWLALIKIRCDNGCMKLEKVPIPEEWKPDRGIPYRERYPMPFPGEEEQIASRNL